MRTSTGVWCTALIMTLTACTQPDPAATESAAPAPADTPASAAWEQMTEAYFDGLFELLPTSAVRAGNHDYDGRLPDLSAAGFERLSAYLARWADRFSTADPGTLDPVQSFERALLMYDIGKRQYYIDDERRPFKNVAYYRSMLSPETYVNLEYAPAAVRMAALTAWAQRIPLAVDQVRANLEVPMPATFAQLATGYFNGMAHYLRTDVKAAFDGVGAPAQQAEFGVAIDAAAAAFDAAAAWAETASQDPVGGYALGPEGFSLMLKRTEWIDLPLDELKRIGEADLAANLERVRAACRTVAPLVTLLECVQNANADKPPGGPVARGQEQLIELKQFVLDKDLVTIPSDDQALVREAPPYQRANLAFIRRPGVLETARLPAIYYIAPADPAWTPAQQAAYVPGESQLLFISAHEVWPGHFLQGLHTRTRPSRVMQHIGSYANSEGWAHYTEQLMWEQGLRDDPVAELGQLMGSLARNVRYLSALGLHTEGMTVQAAQRLFVDAGLTSEGRAIRQAARGTYDPEYLKYTLGKLLILRMRDRWFEQHGRDTLKAFHDRFLSFGAAPLPLIEQHMFPVPSPDR